MKLTRLRTLFAALALSAALLGCKPSIEGETRSFDQNKLTVQEFGGKFPALKMALDARLAEAQQTFDAALQLSDPDQRAQKMRDANNLVTVITGLFREIETKVRDLETLKRDPTLLQLPGTQLMPAMQMSDQLAAQARAQLDQPASNAGELQGRLRDASQLLSRAKEPLERLRAEVAPKTGPAGGPPPAGAPGAPPPAAGAGMPPAAGGAMPPPAAVPGTPPPGATPPPAGIGGAPGFGRPAGAPPPPAAAPAPAAPPPAAAPAPAAPGAAPKPF